LFHCLASKVFQGQGWAIKEQQHKKMQNYSAATATHLKQGWLVVWCQHAAAAP